MNSKQRKNEKKGTKQFLLAALLIGMMLIATCAAVSSHEANIAGGGGDNLNAVDGVQIVNKENIYSGDELLDLTKSVPILSAAAMNGSTPVINRNESGEGSTGFVKMGTLSADFTIPFNLSGNGTSDNPYKISNADELAQFSNAVNSTNLMTYKGAYFQLTANIDLSTVSYNSYKAGWIPIGLFDGTTLSGFDGSFDGNNKIISNLNITGTKDSVGLFTYLGVDGVVKNLGIDANSSISGKNYVGGIVGINDGSVTNCYNAGSVSGTGDNVGGIVGENTNEVTNCYNTGTVSGTGDSYDTGGIVGHNYFQDNHYGNVSDCYNTGLVSGSSIVGGVVGDNEYTVTNCFNAGPVSGSNTIGGVAGDNAGTITYCYNTGSVGGVNIGGVVGNNESVLTYCYNAGWVAGSSYVGGVVAANTGTLSKCYYNSDINADNGSGTGLTTAQMTVSNVLTAGMSDLGTTAFVKRANDSNLYYPELKDFMNSSNTVMQAASKASAIAVNYTSGTGTETNPFRINNAVDLAKLASDVNAGNSYEGKYFLMTANINLGVAPYNTGWTPIGNSNTRPFAGIFDGGGFVILGLNITGTNSYPGLFGCTYTDGVVKNLGIDANSTISGGGNTGSVVSVNAGTVLNCYNEGTVSATGSSVGGVVGQNQGTVTNCYNTGSVSGNNAVGGVVGYNVNYILSDCYNTGSVSAAGSAGGVVGQNENGVTKCYNAGSVSSTTTSGTAGGVVGISYNSSSVTNLSVTNCYNTGSVRGPIAVGGVVGDCYGTLSNCYSTGPVGYTTNYTGGVAGQNFGTISICYFNNENCRDNGTGIGLTTAQMTAADVLTAGSMKDLGAEFVKRTNDTNQYYPELMDFMNSSDAAVQAASKASVIAVMSHSGTGIETDPYRINNADDLVKLSDDVNGGINYKGAYFLVTADINLGVLPYSNGFSPIGYDGSHFFDGVLDGGNHVIHDLTITETVNYVGLFGLLGPDGILKNLGIDENSTVTGSSAVGGIVGMNFGSVTSCFNAGTVAGSSSVGGVVGYNSYMSGYNGGTVTNCYNTGKVTGSSFVGGVVGDNSVFNSVTYCYNTGTVSGSSTVGGVVGGNDTNGANNGSVSDCYNTGTVNCSGNSAGVVGQNQGMVTNCFNTGTVSSTGTTSDVGGVVGLNSNMVTNCYNVGSVDGAYVAGGVVGGNTATVTTCYNTGSVYGAFVAGGVVGGDAGALTKSYSAGPVSSGYYADGVAGTNQGGVGTVSSCYYNNEIYPYSSYYGTGLTTAQMTADDVLTTGSMKDLGTGFAKRANDSSNLLYYPELNHFMNSTDTAVQAASKASVTVIVPLVLNSIAVTTPPAKTDYTVGDKLDLTGLVITASYTNSTPATVSGYTTTPAVGSTLSTTGDVTVTVSYTENSVTKTATFHVTVSAAPVVLDSIAVTTDHMKTGYTVGETLDCSGLVVTAYYSDDTSKTVTAYTTDPAAGATLSSVGFVVVTVSYTEGSVTQTAFFAVTVSQVALDHITVTKEPTKNTYTVGDILDLTGLEITAYYSYSSSKAVTGYTTDPAVGSTLSTTGDVTVTVTYTENSVTKTATFHVTVSAAPVVLDSIAVTKEPTTTVYTYGSPLDLSGLVVTAYYSDGTSKAVTGFTTTPAVGSTLSTTGDVTVTVSYTENSVTKTATFHVTVNAPVLDHIFVQDMPAKIDYTVGDTLDLKGLFVAAVYAGSGLASIDNYTTDPADGSILSTPGTVTVTVSYTENEVTKTTSFEVNVNPVVLDSIDVTTMPSKTDYADGEALDLTDMVVTATYSDGSKVTVNNYSVSPPSGSTLNTTGTVTVTVSYTENAVTKTTSFKVTVGPAVLVSIFPLVPSKLEYTVGDALDLGDLLIIAEYSDGTTTPVFNYTISPTDASILNTIGTVTVNVSYTENGVTKTTSFEVTVDPAVLDSIAVTTPPTKTEYTVGDKLDLTDMVVTATYSDGSKATVNNYSTDPADKDVLGTVGPVTVTVTYIEDSIMRMTSFEITVNHALESIAVTTMPRTTYMAGETLDLTGLVVTATYSDSTSKTVTTYTTDPDTVTALTAAMTSVTVSYTENSVTETTSFSITVSAATLQNTTVPKLPSKTVYEVGDSLDLSGMEVTAIYTDGSSKTVTTYTTDPENGAILNTAGPVTVTVSYTEASITMSGAFSITVNAAPVALDSIAVTTEPLSTAYFVGDTLNLTGLVVTATYSDGSSKTVTTYTTDPVAGTTLDTAGSVLVTVSYTEGAVTETATFSVFVYVMPVLDSITVSGPTKTDYIVGEKLDLTGLAVTAHYSDGSSVSETYFTADPADGSILNTDGKVTVTISYSEGSITETATFDVTVNSAPTITGPTTMTLTVGYAATSTAAFTVTGTAPVTVSKKSGDEAITWNSTTMTLDIAAGLAAGEYQVVLTASNVTLQDATATFTLTVSSAPIAPSITGPTVMTLTVGYAATSTGAFSVTGTAPVTVVKTSGDAAITWNSTTMKLDIAAGLAAGDYPVVLTASNGTSPDATITYTLTVNSAPTAPTINGPIALTLTEGYSATSTDAFTVTGTSPITVSKASGDAAITWNSTTMKLDIAAGLTAGVYPVDLTASNGTSPNATITFTLTVISAPIAPTINGPTTMALTVGYVATSSDVFTVSGTSPVTVSKTSGDAAITWNSTTMELDIAAGLTAGDYPVVLTASNGTSPDATTTFTLTVNSAPIAPTITGPTTMALTVGYAATSSDVFTVTGTSPITVSKTSGNSAITWNGGTMKLDIAAGLTAGDYPVVLTASNGTSPDATITFTLTVNPAPIAPTITGPTTMTLTVGYAATSSDVFTVTGTAPVTVSKTSGNTAITWNSATMKLDIAAGLTAGDYPVVLTASNGTSPDATITFTLTVNQAPIAPTINGPTALTLTEGYAATSTDAFTVTGTSPITVSKASGDAAITWNSSTMKLDIAAGLAAGSYPVVLTASNGTSPDATITFTLTVNSATIAPTITGPTTMALTVGYAATSTGAFTVTGTSPVTVSKTSGNSAITWNGGTMKLDIAAGLAAGSYPVVLTASNGTSPDATTTFTLTVNSATNPPTTIAPTITGPTTMTLTIGYAATSTGVFSVTGTSLVTVVKTSGNSAITWNSGTMKLNIAAGLAAGSYPVVLTASNGTSPNATITFTLTVESVLPTIKSVTVSSSSDFVQKGSTLAFSATVTGDNNPPQTVTWSVTGNNDSATRISSSGVLSVAAGETAPSLIITATSTVDTSVSGMMMIKITAPVISVTGVSLDNTTMDLTAGNTGTITATVSPSDATNKSVTWSSSNTSAAVVSGNGLVEGIGPGTAVITVTTADGKFTASCTVNVKASSEFTIEPGTGTSGGATTATVTNEDMNKAIDWAKKAGSGTVTVVTINVPSGDSPDKVKVDIPASGLSDIAGEGGEVKIISSAGTVTLDNDALKETTKNGGDTVEITIEKVDTSTLNDAQKKAVGDNPVLSVTMTVDGTRVSNLNGNATVKIPYELKSGQDPSKLVVWYIDDSGNTTPYECTYDPATGMVTFVTGHFSYYAVVYLGDSSDEEVSSNNGTTDYTVLYVCIIVIVLVLIVIGAIIYWRSKK